MRRKRSTMAGFLLAFLILQAGTSQAQDVPAYTIRTLAGTGMAGFSGDGGPARDAELDHPSAVAIAPDGRIYIADNGNDRIRMIDTDGTISTVAGSGQRGSAGDGGPATEADLRHPYGVGVGPDGLVYIADQANHRIRRIGADGRIATIAGSGSSGTDGDGGPATDASLSYPNALVWDAAGRMYIGEGGGNRVRRVDLDGRISTVAGGAPPRYNGDGGWTGDGGPADEAGLDIVGDVAIGPDASLYIADLGNHAVRRVDRDGRISTVAGRGRPGFNGDREGVAAMLDEPGGVAVLPDGTLVVADGGNRRIRLLYSDGELVTIAGTGEDGYSGDGGAAGVARLSIMDVLTVDGRGRILFSDYGNNAVRVLEPGGASPDPRRDVEALLGALRNAYASIDAISFDFRITRPDAPPQVGHLRRTQDSLVVEMDIPDYGVPRIATDGYRLTIEDPRLPNPLVLDHDRESLSHNVVGNLTVYSIFDWKRQLSTAGEGNMADSDLGVRYPVSWRGRDWIVLDESAGSSRYEYYVDPARKIIERTVRYSEGEAEPAYESEITRLWRLTAP